MVMIKQDANKRIDEDYKSPVETGEEGFTLVELMVVVFIMGLLATVVLVNVMGNVDTSRVKKAQVDIAALESSLDRYRLQLIDYPTTEQGLEALVTAPDDLSNPALYPKGGFIKRLPLDPWNNAYQYVYPGEHGEIDIYSLGADGQLGGEELDADIGNWTN
ncbi:type II secretion system major pseudopilin GspG [Hirschia baltica]|uniref:Type II secretion system core protein G n=1 Tax=Hirschia baltica (strain ATCC 49814 / DSM 5838 / IFAM 1418) TaxID=582402 RepID=C6XJ50_HIRBI|nr:type II secretion system major pseudopilin GspG [Hirschia baltica]ACT59145.1 general secretion pathway protein G [Hirschia baltica ATCC 49814]